MDAAEWFFGLYAQYPRDMSPARLIALKFEHADYIYDHYTRGTLSWPGCWMAKNAAGAAYMRSVRENVVNKEI